MVNTVALIDWKNTDSSFANDCLEANHEFPNKDHQEYYISQNTGKNGILKIYVFK